MRIAIVACGDGDDVVVPTPRDLDGVVYVDQLCSRPGDLARVLAGAQRAVMIVHPGELALGAVQRAVRSAGIDPLGVQYVGADAIGGDARRATVLLAGAVARAEAYVGSRPEHARPRFGGRRSRRELLSVPQPFYEALPVIDEGLCAAADGCRACVVECPQTAYEWSAGSVRFDRDACVTCGRCLTACPTGAIGTATVSGRALTEQVTALVSGAAPDAVGVAFVCRQRTRAVAAHGWAEVEVPCTGMVAATWPIAALLLGAAGVAVRPCSATGCGLGGDERAGDAVALARDLISAAGFTPAAVLAEPGDLAGPIGPVTLDDPFGVHGPTEVALALGSVSEACGPIVGSGVAAGRGLVQIDPDACTVCLACAQTCPTGALVSHSATNRVSITFEAARCTGCSQCVPVCPELQRGAIGVARQIDVGALGAEPRQLVASATPTCERCGAPIASTAMLDRISDLLGHEHEAATGYLTRRCLDCRGI